MPFCTACGQENPDRARFCLSCGTPLAPPAPPSEERKPITAVFCDLVGSTARAEQLDPEDVRALLVPYHSRAKAELERFGGTVEKFIGDAVVGVFGAPLSHEDDPERAVRAALAMKDAVAELNVEDEWLDLHVRIGVNTGEALVIVDARPSEGEGMAAGDVMNTAARIQSAAPVDGVAVGGATFRATTAAFEYRELESIQAKGKSEPVPVWELIGERAEAPLTVHRTPLVGRARELEQLSSVWDAVLSENRPALATVLGAPGIGKSRLLRALSERIGPDAAVHSGRCLSYGEGITYWPVIEIVNSAAEIRQTDSAECVGERLDTLLDSLPTRNPDELRTIATALANLTGAPTTPRGTYTAEELPQAELHWGIRRALQLLARKRPLLLVFEDLHWAEPTLLELLQFLVEPGSEVPILVIGTARPELADVPHAIAVTGPAAHVVELRALSDQDGEALVAELLGGDAASDRLPAALLRKAGGNPLFLEELVRMLADAGVLDGAVDPETLPIPDSLQALLGSRLDTLAGEVKQTAQHASVIGSSFWVGAVSHLNGAIDPLPRLVELERRDFVHAQPESSVVGDSEYAFKHILIRDVAYERLPRGRRAELHVRFSEWLDQLQDGTDEFVEILAYHLEQACRLARSVAHSPVSPPVADAARALIRSAEKAERREGIREADRFYERALALAGDESPEIALDLRLRRSRTLIALGELRRAHEELVAVAEAATHGERPDILCGALLALANVERKQGQASSLRERLERAEALAADLGDDRLQVRVWFELTWLHAWFEGDEEAGIEYSCRAVALAEAVDDRDLQVEGHMRLGSMYFNTGRLREAEEELERCLALASGTGSIRDDARASSMLGLYRFYRGDLDDAERLALQAAEWLDRTGDTFLQVQNLRDLARYALGRGALDVAETRLREALPLALETGGWLVIEIYRYLTETLVREGRVDEASELVAFAARNLPEEDPYARAALRIAEGIVETALGEGIGATRSFTEATTILEEQHLRTDLGEARILLARALRRFGDVVAARAELERARNIFAPMEAGGPLAEIERELADLGVGAGAAGPHS